MTEENKTGMNGAPELSAAEDPAAEESEDRERRGWREIFRQAFERARLEQGRMSKSGKGRDRSRSLVLLAGVAVSMILLFLVVFSSPNAGKNGAITRQTTPDLGRRITPGEQASGQTASVAPLLDAQPQQSASQGTQAVTPEEVNQTAHPAQPAAVPNPSASAPGGNQGEYALGGIDFSDPTSRRQATENNNATGRSLFDDLKMPSLVFVRSAPSGAPSSDSKSVSSAFDGTPVALALPAGTRLSARLESVVTSAVKAPVVASIEYNYEQHGEIVVPAGAMAIGSLIEADRSGCVTIHFDSLELPDGTSEKIDGAAISLSYGPLKGHAVGKKAGKNFLVRAFTGIGEAATYLAGSGGSGAPLSENSLLRDRLATNIGMAGDQELSSLAISQNIIVSVPANTRFYIVIEKSEREVGAGSRPAEGQNAGSELPSLGELRQLMQLRRELNEMYRQSSTAEPAPQQ